MLRPLVALLVGALVLSTSHLAAAQSEIPAEIQPYRTWTKMNAALLTDPSNPRAAPKNTFINLRANELREIIGPGGAVRRPFPDGTIIVRETNHPTEGWAGILFIQRKDSAATRTQGWVFSGFSRASGTQPFQPVAIADPVSRCLDCHAQVKNADFVFTPYLNRPDALPARAPTAPDRVEIFNNRFGPDNLRVKAGATVVWANYDAVPHDVKAADRSFESGNLPLLGRHIQVFSRPGTVEYFCAVHLEMRGRILVEP